MVQFSELCPVVLQNWHSLLSWALAWRTAEVGRWALWCSCSRFFLVDGHRWRQIFLYSRSWLADIRATDANLPQPLCCSVKRPQIEVLVWRTAQQFWKYLRLTPVILLVMWVEMNVQRARLPRTDGRSSFRSGQHNGRNLPQFQMEEPWWLCPSTRSSSCLSWHQVHEDHGCGFASSRKVSSNLWCRLSMWYLEAFEAF